MATMVRRTVWLIENGVVREGTVQKQRFSPDELDVLFDDGERKTVPALSVYIYPDEAMRAARSAGLNEAADELAERYAE